MPQSTRHKIVTTWIFYEVFGVAKYILLNSFYIFACG